MSASRASCSLVSKLRLFSSVREGGSEEESRIRNQSGALESRGANQKRWVSPVNALSGTFVRSKLLALSASLSCLIPAEHNESELISRITGNSIRQLESWNDYRWVLCGDPKMRHLLWISFCFSSTCLVSVFAGVSTLNADGCCT